MNKLMDSEKGKVCKLVEAGSWILAVLIPIAAIVALIPIILVRVLIPAAIEKISFRDRVKNG